MPQKIFVLSANQLILSGQEKYLYNYLENKGGLSGNISAIVVLFVAISFMLLT